MGIFLSTLAPGNRLGFIPVYWLQAIRLGLFLCTLAARNRPGPIPGSGLIPVHWRQAIGQPTPGYIGSRQ